MSQVGLQIPNLDCRIADDDVVPNYRIPRARRNKQPVRISGNIVFFDDVIDPAIDDADAKIVGRFSVSVAMCLI